MPVGRALEIAPRGRGREGQEPHRQADHDRVDARLRQRDPGGDAQRRVHEASLDAEPHREDDRGKDPGRAQQRARVEAGRVHGRDHDQRDDVVDDRHGEHERTEAERKARPDEGEHPKGERGVRRHRDAPSVRRVPLRVQREEDCDRHEHPADARRERQRHPATFAEFAQVELPARLEPTTKKKRVISPLFSQYRRSCDTPVRPMRIERVVCQTRP